MYQHNPTSSALPQGPAPRTKTSSALTPGAASRPVPLTVPLQNGDFIAVLSKWSDDNKPRWILGQVESPPYEGDADIRFWEKQRDTSHAAGETNPEITALMEHIQHVQEDLSDSMDHAVALSAEMRQQRQAILKEIRDAEEYVKESKAIMSAARDDVEKIPDKHWQELKSYRVAPKMVSIVLRAVMLLLCEDEARTWPQMQKVLRDINFKSRITSYNAEMRLSPERREFIMRECVSRKGFRYESAMQGSLAMGPIYYWVLAQLDCGEAFLQKHKVDREKMARQRELRALLRKVNTQAQRMCEHLALMDDLDEEIRRCYHRASSSAHQAGHHGDGVVTARYKNSFAGREDKMHLKPAYYDWKPTNRVLTIMRNTVLCNFGPLSPEQASGMIGGMSDRHVHLLDNAINQRMKREANENPSDREKREQAEYRRLERNILRMASEEGISDHWDSLNKRFEGDQWQTILERRRQDVMDIFAEESSRCLRIPKENVAVNDFSVTQPLLVAFDVCHSGRRDIQELQDTVNEYEYPLLHSLYEAEASAGDIEEAPQETAPRVATASVKEPPTPLTPFDGHVFGIPPAVFTGVAWEDCLHAKRPQLSDVFTDETAQALEVSPQNVVVNTIKASPEGIEFFYEVYDCRYPSTEVLRRTAECPYPRLWGLYSRFNEEQQAQRIGRYEKTFEGSDWARVVQNRRLDLEDHFLRDESTCLRVMPNQIHIRSVHANAEGLTVRYDVAAMVKLSVEEVNKTACYPYPHMWALYEDADGMITSHEIGFEGDGWEEVLQNNYDELQHRFVRCTSDLLGLKDDDILQLRFSTGSLFANFDLRHSSHMTELSINEKLSQCPFLPVWELLPLPGKEETPVQVQERSAPQTIRSTSHELGFEGAAWKPMLAQEYVRVRAAVLAETCRALLQVDPQDISVTSLKFADESLVALVLVQHGGSEEEVQEALEQYPFLEVWNLLEEEEEAEAPPPPVAPTRRPYSAALEKKFPGADWDLVLEQHPRQLRAAFQDDAAAAIGIRPEDIEILDVRLGSLIVTYRVREPNVSDEQLRQSLHEDYTFPKVQALYRCRSASRGDTTQPRDGPRLDTVKEFRGMEWANLVENHLPAVERAAMRDISAARHAPEEDITLHHIFPLPDDHTDGPGMRISYGVAPRSPEETAYDFQREAETYPFPLTEALHRSIPRHMHTEKYSVHFDADGWSHVVRRYRWELARALADDSGEACSISPDEVVDCEFHVAPDALTADMCICHAKTIPRRQVEEALFLCPFRRVWAMYERFAASPLLKREFRGEGWEAVNKVKGTELRRAFSKDTANALDVEPMDVEVQEVGTNHGGCCVTYQVRQDQQPPALSAEQIDERSASFLYPELWALYELYGRVARHQNFNASKVFGGDRWRSVLTTRRQAVTQAFQEDASNALHLPVEAIAVPSVEANEASLTVHYLINADAETDVSEQLDAYDYPLLWEEYNREGSISLSDVDHREVSGTLHRRFDGDLWDGVLQCRRVDVNQCFAKGVSDAVGIPAGSVEILDTRVGSLLVDYRILQPPYEDEDIDAAVQRHDFPELMALHPIAAPYAARAPPPIVKEFEVPFLGDQWPLVVQHHSDKLQRAFEEDTADCLGCTPMDFKNVDFSAGQEMIAYFGVMESALPLNLTLSEVEHQLHQYRYTRVWALYPRPSTPPVVVTPPPMVRASPQLVVSTHGIHFGGDMWGMVCEMMADRVRHAVTGDVVECLKLPEKEVLDTWFDVTPNEALNAYVKVQHPVELHNEKIKELMAEFRYPRVWSLVDTAREGRIRIKQFEGDRWKDILRQNKRGVSLAFQNDVSAMTSLPATYCRLHAVEADDRCLSVHYGVLGSFYTDDQIHSREKRHTFPKVWAYYHVPQDHLHKCKLTFPGEHWDDFFKDARFRQALDKAFYKDISACFPSLDTINLDSMHTTVKDGGALTIDFTSTAPQAQYVEARRRVNTYDYPAIWDLYRVGLNLRETPAPPREIVSRRTSAITTRHEITLEGRDWDYTWNRKQPLATNVFETEIAKALHVPSEHVSQTRMKPVDGGIVLGTSVHHPADMTPNQIGSLLERHPYHDLWALYEPRPREETSAASVTLIHFEGPDWDFVMSRRANEVHHAIVEDTSRALNVPIQQIQDIRCKTDKQGLHSRLQIAGVSRQRVNELHTYPYPSVWNLYIVPERAIQGVRRFDGNWQPSAQNPGFHNAVQCAFSADVGDALRVDPNQDVEVVRQQLDEAGNLVVRYKIHRQGLHSDQVQNVLQQHGFPRVWELYVAPLRTSGDLHRRFPGDRWGPVLENRRGDVHQCFAKGVSDAVGVPPSSVEILDTRVGSLLVDYRIHNPPFEDDNTHDRVQRHGFPELMALHPQTPPPPPAFIISPMNMHFDGSGWTDVVHRKRPELISAFQRDTAGALGLPIDAIQVTDLSNCLTVYFTARHPAHRSFSEMQREVNQCPYAAVWALYEQPGPVTTQHDLHFQGTHWITVDAEKHAELQDAMLYDAADAAGVSSENVRVLSIGHHPNQMTGRVAVTHGNERDVQAIRRLLDEDPYRRVWALYETKRAAPVISRKPSVSQGTGTVQFYPGEHWEEVIQRHRSAVRSAFIHDTCDELHCPARQVQVHSLFTSPRGLSINYDVDNGQPAQDNARVLSNAAYPTVWKLYQMYGTAPPPLPRAPSSGDRYTPWCPRRFEGADWDIPLQESRRELEHAFKTDVARVLGVPAHNVEVREMQLGSLLVTYRVKNSPLSDAETARAVDHDAMPEVWRLYSSRPAPATVQQRQTPPPRRFSSFSNAEQTPWRSSQQLQPPATRDPALTGRRSYRSQPPQQTEEERQVQRQLQEAQQRAERARREREAAEAEAQRRAREAEEEERRLQHAREAAERMRCSRRSGPIDAEEDECEEDQLTYLRRALAQAREERDRFQSMADSQKAHTSAHPSQPGFYGRQTSPGSHNGW